MGALFAKAAMGARRQVHDRAGKDNDRDDKAGATGRTLFMRPIDTDLDHATAGQAGAAVAPGVVEPRSGQVKIAAPVIGRVSDVMVKINDKVAADQPLVRLDDEDAEARVASAQAQVAMREKARNEKSAGKAANRRDAEDAVADT